MKYFQLKIRPHFLPLIRNGIKTHEYRLAINDIRVGDVLVLMSNQDLSDYEKVVVKKIEHFTNWEEALYNTWENDFKGAFTSLEDIMKECRRFYSKEDTDKFGIDVYEFVPYSKKFANARYLLDTNVIIERESANNAQSEVALTYKWIEKIGGHKFIHPLTKDELIKHSDKLVVRNMLTKLKSYDVLIASSEENDIFKNVCGVVNDENTKIDNQILLQVYNGTVDYLITSDRGIISKANQLYIKDGVLTPNEFLVAIEAEYPSLIEYNVLSIKKQKFGDLNVNDPFFDSLKKDYGSLDFLKWFKSKNEEDAYVFRNNEGLQGFLYLKTEDVNEKYDDIVPPFSPAKRLKVGTFKINSLKLRLGERFLKIIFDNALKRNVDEVYVTMFEEKRKEVSILKGLMEKWGFVKKGVKIHSGKDTANEIVLVKDMRNYDCSKDPKFNYPLKMNNPQIMFLPIFSKYHTRLFPDLLLKNEDMHLYDEAACGYAIEKIYVCNPPKINCKPGDLVCIYRMGDYNAKYTSVISGIGIVQEIVYPQTIDEFLKECKNKSVFSEGELRDFFDSGKYRTVIKILFLEGLNKKVNYDLLKKNEILLSDDAPQVNNFITMDRYMTLRKMGGLDN